MADKGAPKELLELDPNEVSLVSRPAIRRTFVRVKSEDGGPVGEATRKRRTTTEPTSKEEGGPVTVQIDVEKAGEIISALTQDYLSVVSERVMALKGLIASGGSIEREELWSYMGGIFQALYKAEDQIMILATNIGMSEDVVKAAVSKADRKMTKRRRSELKAATTTLMGLLKELEDDMGAEGTETDTTEKAGEQPAATPATETQPAAKSAEVVTSEVTKAVTDALAPVITAAVAKGIEPVTAQLATLTERVTKLEAPAATPAATPATETQPAAKSEDPSEAIRVAVEKAMRPIVDRLANLETGTAQGSQNTTQQPAAKSGDESSFWSGMV